MRPRHVSVSQNHPHEVEGKRLPLRRSDELFHVEPFFQSADLLYLPRMKQSGEVRRTPHEGFRPREPL